MPLRVLSASDPAAAATVARALRGGGLAIAPTDTVYGVAADVRRDDAVRALYAAKGKRAREPLQLLFPPDAAALAPWARLNAPALRLVEALGPGAWTVIAPAAEGWTSPALAGGAAVGVRMPPAPALTAVLDALGAPLAASSANRHGGPSPATCAQAVAAIGDRCAVALDAGPAPRGLDSTVVDCSRTPLRVLREGAIPAATVAAALGLDAIEVARRAEGAR